MIRYFPSELKDYQTRVKKRKQAAKDDDPAYNTSKIGFTNPDGAGNPSLTQVGNTAIQPVGTGAGTSAGSGAGTGGATGGQDYNARSALGKAVLPGMYGEADNNPDALIRLWFQQQGLGVHGGSYGAALDEADKLKLMWLLMSGEDSYKGTPHELDFIDQRLRNLFTPGGNIESPDQIFQAMQTTDKNNPVYSYLNNPDMTPSDQVQNVGSTLNTSMKGIMPDIVRAAMLARVRELGDQFQATRLQKTSSTPFMSYMTGQGFNI